MRNPNRLDGFYETLKEIHKTHFPDWRFGQLMSNFIAWLSAERRIDMFFPEEDVMINLFREWVGDD